MVMYNISLSDVSNLTDVTLDKVKLVAYLLYDALIDYEDDSRKNILYRENVVSNELYDKHVNGFSRYEFEHTDYDTGKYEPFMINDTSFGFTVYENTVDIKEISLLIDEIKKMVRFDGDFTINAISLKNKRDRSVKLGEYYPKTKSLARRLKLAGIFL